MRVTKAEFITGATQWDELPADGRPEVAFVGRSNVGKSSLLNQLTNTQGLARTSGTPGKTQQFNYFLINNQLYFVDLPGYGYAKVARSERERWGRFIGQFLLERQPLRLVIHLVDSRHAPQAKDEDIMDAMRGNLVPYVIAQTKIDKLSSHNKRVKSRQTLQQALEARAMDVPIVQTSAKTGEGKKELMKWVGMLAT